MPNLGDYVCVRSRDQGVVLGELESWHGRTASIKSPRQLWSWRGGNALTLIDAILLGPEAAACRMSRTLPGEIIMTETCGIYSVPPDKAQEFRDYPHDNGG